MTLQQIIYLLTIAECRSMNKAAEKMYVAQSTLTGAVKDVEKELGNGIGKPMFLHSRSC